MELVKQKLGRQDCVIACVANALSITYEAAELLLQVKGHDLPKGGVDVCRVIHPLLTAGWAGVLLVADEGNDPTLPSQEDIKNQLPGRKTLIGYKDAEAGPHLLYWDGAHLHDCSTPPPAQEPDLATLKVDNALVLFPVDRILVDVARVGMPNLQAKSAA